MKKIRIEIPPIILIAFVVFVGFIAGVLSIALWKENWLISEGILNSEFISDITELKIDKRALFFLCLGRRMRAFFLLFLLSFSSVNSWVNFAFFLLSGFFAGSVVEILTIRYGMQGIAMYFTMIFPQGLCYILGFLILGCWCLKRESIERSLRERKIQKIRKIENKKAIIISCVLILAGIIIESYINPKIFFFFI